MLKLTFPEGQMICHAILHIIVLWRWLYISKLRIYWHNLFDLWNLEILYYLQFCTPLRPEGPTTVTDGITLDFLVLEQQVKISSQEFSLKEGTWQSENLGNLSPYLRREWHNHLQMVETLSIWDRSFRLKLFPLPYWILLPCSGGYSLYTACQLWWIFTSTVCKQRAP